MSEKLIEEADQIYKELIQMCAPHAASLVRRLAAELATAREIIDKLPKTDDGVPILVGSVVWKLADPISAGVVIQIGKGGAAMSEYEGCDGCSTGDCPHENVNDCVQAQGKIIAEQAAEIDSLAARLAAAEAEREGMREALAYIAEPCGQPSNHIPKNHDSIRAFRLAKATLAALAPATEKGAG